MRVIAMAVAFSFVLLACSGADGSGAVGEKAGGKVKACQQRGVAYFKEIGSYPTLRSAPDTGRRAEDVALERCRRTLTAF